MKNKHVKSILNRCTEGVFQATSVHTAKTVMKEIINESNVKTKNKMLIDLEQLNSLVAVQRYCANALLKFEGLGVS
jgi:hypothetical protein